MTRPVDWSPLADSDPVPGEPHEVARMGRHYSQVADAIDRAARNLRRLASEPAMMKSKAVDAFRDTADDVAEEITKAHERYAGVGKALTDYEPYLTDAQSDSLAALRAAQQAEDDAAAAQRRADSAGQAESSATDPASKKTHQDAKTKAQGEVDAAQGRLDAARRKLEEAVQNRDDAASRAVSAIQDVEDSGDLNDSWWDDWGHKVVEVIQRVASVVALVCGVLALVVGWIPVIGQALAGILGTIALVATAVSLICNIALASTGYGDWASVGWDALSLVTFGAGRLFGTAAKASTKAASVATGRTRGASWLVDHALSGGNPVARFTSEGGEGLYRSLVGSGANAWGTARATATSGVTEFRTIFSSPMSVLRGAYGNLGGSFMEDLATVRSATNRSAAQALLGDAARGLLTSPVTGGARITLTRLYGDYETATHLQVLREAGLRVPIWSQPPIVWRSTLSNTLAIGSNVIGNLNDTRELLSKFSGDSDQYHFDQVGVS